MEQKRFTLSDIARELDLPVERLKEWIGIELVVPSKDGKAEFFVEEDLERFRVIRNLIDDLEVNIEGVEVILRMRDRTIGMEKFLRKVFALLEKNGLLDDALIEEFKKLG